MRLSLALATSALSLGVMVAPAASAAVIEDFETGSFGPAWTSTGGSPTVTTEAARDGNFGVSTTNEAWLYRNDAAASIDLGSVLSAWVRPTGGRFYLGFAADNTGANSFVVAPNTGQLLFQNNENFGFSNVVGTNFSFNSNQWYLASVTFGPQIVGNLFDSDGTTLLASLTAQNLSRGSTGGIAVRSFGGSSFDTISLNTTAGAVPEPGTWAMMLLGMGAIGLGMRRRKGIGSPPRARLTYT